MSLKRKLMTSVMTMGLVSALVGGATFAIFTDSSPNENNTFTAGTVILASDNLTSWSEGVDNMAPGDTVTKDVYVRNDGTLELRYDVAAEQEGYLLEEGSYPAEVTYYRNGTEFTPGNNDFVLAADDPQDTITIEVYLPYDAGNNYQNASGSIGLTFDAEQTINN